MGEIAGRAHRRRGRQWDVAPGFWSTIGEHTLKYVAWGDGFDEARLVDHGDGAWTVWYGDRGPYRRRAHPRARRGLRARPRAGRDRSPAAVSVARVRRRPRARRGGADRRVHRRARRPGRRRPDAYEVMLVLDRCTDATAARARQAAAGDDAARDRVRRRRASGTRAAPAWTSPPSGSRRTG